MTFFIPGRTNCGICGRLIAHSIDAVRPDWAHPDDVGELAQLSRDFVHHDCWRTWEHRDRFTAAARALRLKGIDEEPFAECDGVFLYKRGEALSIEDVSVPIWLFISETEKLLVPNWLFLLITQGRQDTDEPETLVMGNHSLSASWHDDELEITLAYDGEANQRFSLSPERQAAWLAVLQKATPHALEGTG